MRQIRIQNKRLVITGERDNYTLSIHIDAKGGDSVAPANVKQGLSKVALAAYLEQAGASKADVVRAQNGII